MATSQRTRPTCCPKCGGQDFAVRYIRVGGRPEHRLFFTAGDRPYFREVLVPCGEAAEHLHYVCLACQYDWAEPPGARGEGRLDDPRIYR